MGMFGAATPEAGEEAAASFHGQMFAETILDAGQRSGRWDAALTQGRRAHFMMHPRGGQRRQGGTEVNTN